MGGSLYLEPKSALLGAIQAELEATHATVAFRSATDVLHALAHVGHDVDADSLIFVDAINEHDNPTQMRKAIQDLVRKIRGKRIRLLVSCRDYYWGVFQGLVLHDITDNTIVIAENFTDSDTNHGFTSFSPQEYEQAIGLYFAHYQISGHPIGSAAVQCRHPLLLRFFCEAYRGQQIGIISDIRLKELFDVYWTQKFASIAERMIEQGDLRVHDSLVAEIEDCLLSLARYMLNHNTRSVPFDRIPDATGRRDQSLGDPTSTFGRIRDEFIILEETLQTAGRRKDLHIVFVYEEFMEYVMARALLDEWAIVDLAEDHLIAKLEALTNKVQFFAQIIGVVVYLALMLRDVRNIDFWWLLLKKGGKWTDVVFESIRKLPEKHLDRELFAALEEMITKGDETVKIAVMDCLKIERVGKMAPDSTVARVGQLALTRKIGIARRAALALGNMPFDSVRPGRT
jgi:hypothetical protein